ncbi:ABC transporter permease [Acuticoccus mangrovi]|uniref:ABC transporter permease n=1 Tax=Acuticoccus mangrovi TaxID=2796142 RepID=A0A934IQK2_9HYPH|nr:ABC transporter permease [Acuticoccus mangrovi]MBJ3776886.1 ABC transporter permease [Acuticoccus mangrovi]
MSAARFLTPRIVVGGALIAALVLVAIFAPLIAPNDPEAQELLYVLLPPAWAPGGDAAFPLGTDSLGRCIASRLVFGTRVALTVALTAATGAMVLGTLLALLAGYFGGRIDWLVSRAVDTWMSFPPVILALILLVGLGAGVDKVILAIIIVDWTRFARVIRSEVLVVRRRDYIAAARLAGFSHLAVLAREVLPAVAPLVITLLSLEMGIAVIVEATMSFVGLSVESDVAAWGVMIADARRSMYQAPWGVVLPTAAIFLTVLGFNLLGDGLRPALDPSLRTRGAR